ncbi:unnamed protein product, partial [Musa hybrid cultivar]
PCVNRGVADRWEPPWARRKWEADERRVPMPCVNRGVEDRSELSSANNKQPEASTSQNTGIEAEMKRKSAPDHEVLSEVPGKAQRRAKEWEGTKAREDAESTEKTRESPGKDESLAHAAAESSPSSTKEDEAVEWDGEAELGGVSGCWWWWLWWGVDEEKLSGWFPFADEDFLRCEDRGGGEAGSLVLWEEEDHDIWELRRIHEVPNAARQ